MDPFAPIEVTDDPYEEVKLFLDKRDDTLAGVDLSEYAIAADSGPKHLSGHALLDLLDAASGPIGEKSPKVTFRDMVAPYYGNRFDDELAKASRAYDELDPRNQDFVHFKFGKTKPLQNVDDPVSVSTQKLHGYGVGEPADKSQYLGWRNSDGTIDRAIQLRDTRKSPFKDYSLYDMSIRKEVDPERSTLEHEIGHHVFSAIRREMPIDLNTRKVAAAEGVTKNEAWENFSGFHMMDPQELVNGLGRINREQFQRTGSRFTRKTLDAYLDSLDDSKGIQGQAKEFSADARRTIDLLWRAKRGQLVDQNKNFYEEATKLLPLFVENERKQRDEARALFG